MKNTFAFEFFGEGDVFGENGELIDMENYNCFPGTFQFVIIPDDKNFIFQIRSLQLFLDKEQKENYLFWDEGDLTIEQIKNDIIQVLERKELFI